MRITIREPQSQPAISYLPNHYIPHQKTYICNDHSIFKGFSGAPAVVQYHILAVLLSVFNEGLAYGGAKT